MLMQTIKENPIEAGFLLLVLWEVLKALGKPLLKKVQDGPSKGELARVLSQGDEQFAVLSQAVAFMLRVLPVICQGVGLKEADCQEFKREAADLEKKLVISGKCRATEARDARYASN